MTDWMNVLPPSRPTVVELERIAEKLKTIDKEKAVAILGSTPEFCDLLADFGFERIVAFDKSREYHNKMCRVMTQPDKVRLIGGDWLSSLENPHLRVWDKKFALILSDLTMGNVDYRHRAEFYQLIAGNLEPDGGMFIDKVLCHDRPHLKLADLFAKYEKLPFNLQTLNHFSSEVLFCSELLEKNQKVESTKFYEIIAKEAWDAGRNPKIHKFLTNCNLITPKGFTWYYGKPWDELKDEYEKPFSKSEFVQDTDEQSPYYLRGRQYFHTLEIE